MSALFQNLAGKRVLVTGHTGFTGSWASLWLSRIGAEVFGFALEPETNPSLFHEAGIEKLVHSRIGDIRNQEKLKNFLQETKPDLVIHLAAQPLVRRSYRIPSETFEVNVQGTVNVLEAARKTDSVRGVLCITTDKVYKNYDSGKPFIETDELGGSDPYSASKAAAEIAISSYRESFFKNGLSIVAARGGNIIGGGDWSEDRLIPDLVRAWHQGRPLEIRNPEATRPWQHVLGLVDGYLRILNAMVDSNSRELHSAYNFGPAVDENLTVSEVVASAASTLGSLTIAQVESPLKEAAKLNLDSSLAREKLAWIPPWNAHESIQETIEWYRGFYLGTQAIELCEQQIESWEEAAGKAVGGRG